jgi:dienelactone hydrolase
MSEVVIEKANGYAGASYPNEGSLFMYRRNQPAGEGPGIICLHGRGGTCLQYVAHTARDFAPGWGAYLLAREGYRVLAIDDMGGAAWGNQTSTDRINDAIAYLQSTGGAKAGKVGIMGWSMGGIAALNWLDQNPVKHACSWLWCPATDLDYFHNNATYTAEIDAAYPTYATSSVGQSPAATPANYRNVGPIKIVHASDDTTIPLSQSQAFVTAVNDPKVTLTQVIGGHTALFGQVTDSQIVSHFKANLA